MWMPQRAQKTCVVASQLANGVTQQATSMCCCAYPHSPRQHPQVLHVFSSEISRVCADKECQVSAMDPGTVSLAPSYATQ